MRGLPRLLVLTDRRASERCDRPLSDTVRRAVSGGARAIVLREKDLPRAERELLAREVRELVPKLVIASDADLALAVGADGIHLAADDPWPDQATERVAGDADPGFVVGRSCHDELAVRRAAHEGATYATLSPVFASASKPGYGPPLGVGVLHSHPLPVYALGGVEPGRAAPCVAAGAAGVAVMGAVMGVEDPARVVRRLLLELGIRP
ncbi:MAG: thiamine phosphate synthase [Acidimicrobiales bacterium]